MDYVFALEDGGHPQSVKATYIVPEGPPWDGYGPFVPTDDAIVLFEPPGGYWRILHKVQTAPGQEEICFPSLRNGGPLGWWHELHGISRSDIDRGKGIRIGVVDEGLEPQSEESCIFHVRNLGDEGWDRQNSGPSTYVPHTDHSASIASLIGSRCSSPGGYQGFAPGAELLLASARSPRKPGKVSMSRVAHCIDLLSSKYECDLITISSGDHENPLDDLLSDVQDARDQGSLCIFAAGNTGRTYYPAAYPECIAVAAIGRYHTAPPGSDISARAQSEAESFAGDDVFLWRGSARGPLIELEAAGVGPIWNRLGKAQACVTGTSYSAPLAAGCLAAILSNDDAYSGLPRDASRTAYAETVMKRHSTRMRLHNSDYASKYGRLTV